MSIRYGVEGCEHLWGNRTDGYEEHCAAIVCMHCGAYGCMCDLEDGTHKEMLHVDRAKGVHGDADVNGKWMNPYAITKRAKEATNLDLGNGYTVQEAGEAMAKLANLGGITLGDQETDQKTVAEEMTQEEKVIFVLRDMFEGGHPDFIPMMVAKMKMHAKKNKGYAQGGRPLGNFERSEAIKKLYPGFDWSSAFGTAIDYLLKQFDCALWQYAMGYQDEVEDIPARLGDVSIYSDLAIILIKAEVENKAKSAEMQRMTDQVMEDIREFGVEAV